MPAAISVDYQSHPEAAMKTRLNVLKSPAKSICRYPEILRAIRCIIENSRVVERALGHLQSG